MDTTTHSFTLLPTEILILILYPLDVPELIALAKTCKRLHELVYEYGWTQHLSWNTRPSWSLASTVKDWSPRRTVRYNTLTDRAWHNAHFVARPLGRTFPAKEQSTLAISTTRLVVAAGTFLHSYLFFANGSGKPSIQLEGTITLNETHVRGRNITAVAFLEDGGLDQTLLVAYQEQLVERITLIPPTAPDKPLAFSRTPLPGAFPIGDYIESFSTCSGQVLSLSSNGTARLSFQHTLDNVPIPEEHPTDASTSTPPPPPSPPRNTDTDTPPLQSTIHLSERAWKAHLALTPSSAFAALGSTGKTPLTIHPIHPASGLAPRPSTLLHTERLRDAASEPPSSAVYGLSTGPPGAPWGASPAVLASGWFDGRVRIYDLRTPSSSADTNTSNSLWTTASVNGGPTIPLLRPVLTLADRWSSEPIYAVACGGGAAAHVAAGTARHSVVAFWDVRSPKDGWSVYAPGNDRSPVFGVVVEGSRVFGTTERRAFVYDFGPDATPDMYPSISSSGRSGRDADVLKHKPGMLSYRVTKYRHKKGLTDDF